MRSTFPVSQLMTADEVAEMLSISVRHVWRLVREDGQFPRPVRIGRRSTRFRRADLDHYLNAMPETAVSPKEHHAH